MPSSVICTIICTPDHSGDCDTFQCDLLIDTINPKPAALAQALILAADYHDCNAHEALAVHAIELRTPAGDNPLPEYAILLAIAATISDAGRIYYKPLPTAATPPSAQQAPIATPADIARALSPVSVKAPQAAIVILPDGTRTTVREAYAEPDGNFYIECNPPA